jgi:serine/threonine-protein kinase
MKLLRVLGSLDLRGPDGEVIHSVLSQPKRSALLAYLAVARPRGFHRRDTLLGLFWPESDEEHARAALSSALSFLRKSLGEGIVHTRGTEEVGIDPELLETDVGVFEEGLEAGDLVGALEQYRGHLLEGFHLSGCSGFEQWIDVERERLRRLAAGAAWAAARREIESGELPAAERLGQRALDLVGTDESAVREFIEALAGAGGRAAAVRFYERFAAALGEDLELRPDSETRKLVERIRAPREAPGPGGPPSETPGAVDVPIPDPLASVRPLARDRSTRGRSRPAVILGTFALVVALLATIVSMCPSRAANPMDTRVVVLPLSNETGDPSLDHVPNWAAEHITHGLLRANFTQVVQFTDVALAVAASPSREERPLDLGTAWPQLTGATLAVTGAFYLLGDSIEFRLRIVDPEGTVQGTVEPVQGRSDDPSDALGELQVRVLGAISELVSPNAVMLATLGRHPPKPEALELTLDGWTLALQEGRWEASLPYLRRANELDPDYHTPLYVLATFLKNLGRFAEADSVCRIMEGRLSELTQLDRLLTERICARTRGDHNATLEASRRLTEMRRNNTSVLGNDYLALNRPRKAAEAYSLFDPNLGEISRLWTAWNWHYWSRAHHLLGDYSRELEIALEALESFPEHPRLNNDRISALIGLGRLEQAERLVEQRRSLLGRGQNPSAILSSAAREYEAHGHPELARDSWRELLEWYSSRAADGIESAEHRRARAETLLFLSWDIEAQVLLEALAEEFAEDLDDQGRLGVLRGRQGDEAGARAISEALRGWPEPFLRGRNTLWRARIAAASGIPGEAVRLLEQAHGEGWEIFDYPHRDPYLKRLRAHPAFEEFIRPKG